MPRPRLILYSLVSLLLAVIGLQAAMALRVPAPVAKAPLASVLPMAAVGWTVQDEAIASSPEMKKAVGELLNYSDGVFRIYQKGPVQLAVYVAYWQPGTMSQRLVAGHTPDVCWVGNGWVRQEGADTAAQLAGTSAVIKNAGLPEGQSRVYELKGGRQHVVFWHVFGNRLISYDTGYAPPWYAPITDLFEHGLNQRQEQYFIRLSSNRPLEEMRDEPAFQAVIESLRTLALGACVAR